MRDFYPDKSFEEKEKHTGMAKYTFFYAAKSTGLRKQTSDRQALTRAKGRISEMSPRKRKSRQSTLSKTGEGKRSRFQDEQIWKRKVWGRVRGSKTDR